MDCHALPNDKARNDEYNDSVNAESRNDDYNDSVNAESYNNKNTDSNNTESLNNKKADSNNMESFSDNTANLSLQESKTTKAFHNAIESKQVDCHALLRKARNDDYNVSVNAESHNNKNTDSNNAESLNDDYSDSNNAQYFNDKKHSPRHCETSARKSWQSTLTESKPLVPYVTLGEVCEVYDNLRKPIAKSKRVGGDYPYYGANGIQDYVNGYLFDGEYLLIGEDGSVMNKDSSPVLHFVSGKFWANNHAHIIQSKNNNLRFLYYALQCCNIFNLVKGTPPKLNQENLKTIQIPLPPLAVQEEIVSILDKFDSLTNDLVNGIPAEIEARKKQYEYYRERLLDFKEIG